MKILLLCGNSRFSYIFRKELIKEFISQGHSVSVHCLDSQYKDHITKFGCDFYSIESSNRSLSIFKSNQYKNEIKKLTKSIEPDYVISFMAKPNTFGVLGASKGYDKCKIISMVEGSGDIFNRTSFKWKVIRFFCVKLFRKSFKKVKYVYFLNEDDRNKFVKDKILSLDKTRIMHGIGVNIEKFNYSPIENYKTIGFASRLVYAKGVIDYCNLARIVKQKDPSFKFLLAGIDSEININTLKPYIDDGSIEFLGEVHRMNEFYKSISIFISMSDNEGFPLSIMEAMSSGRLCFANNVVGNNDAVVDGKTGFLIDKSDLSVVAEKLMSVVSNKHQMDMLSKNAREYAEKYFDSHIIQHKFIDEIMSIK